MKNYQIKKILIIIILIFSGLTSCKLIELIINPSGGSMYVKPIINIHTYLDNNLKEQNSCKLVMFIQHPYEDIKIRYAEVYFNDKNCEYTDSDGYLELKFDNQIEFNKISIKYSYFPEAIVKNINLKIGEIKYIGIFLGYQYFD